MIYLFHGSDISKTRAKAFEWIRKARDKEPNLAYIRLAAEDVTQAALESVASVGGLFVQRTLVLLDDPYGAQDTSCVEDFLPSLAASDNAIIVLAPGLTATQTKKLVSKATKAYVFEKQPDRTLARGFNSALVNALNARKREALWVELERALRAGDAPEMLHGLLHWKVRDLMQKGSRQWTPGESRKLSLQLIAVLQSCRSGGLPLSRALEKWSLTV